MSTATQTNSYTAATYAAPATRGEMIALAIGCILSGRALPEQLRAPRYQPSRPTTVEEGVARILAGPASVS